MLLLDTHALLWLDSGAPMTRDSFAAIDEAAVRGEVRPTARLSQVRARCPRP
jgi:hypothetical protein